MTAAVVIPGRFNGPRDSGNGGYTSGVIAWPISIDGRKRLAGSAILSPDGEILAIAEGAPDRA